MILAELINTLEKKEIGTFIFCKKHFAELEASNISEKIFRVRKLTRHVRGACCECTEGEQTPITFDETPETLEVYVTFTDDSGEMWSASGRTGRLTYVTDNKGNFYTTQEALKRRGVAKLYIEAGFELHLDA